MSSLRPASTDLEAVADLYLTILRNPPTSTSPLSTTAEASIDDSSEVDADESDSGESTADPSFPSTWNALRTLMVIASGDYSRKSMLVERGIFPVLVDLLTRYEKSKIVQLVAEVIWALCVGHPANKVKAAECGAIQPLLSHLRKSVSKEVQQAVLQSLWSMSYTVPSTQTTIVNLGTLPILCDIMRENDVDLMYSATGLLFHVTSQPVNRFAVAKAGLVPHIIRFVQFIRTSAANNSRHLIATLTLANVVDLTHPDMDTYIDPNERQVVLKLIEEFVCSQNVDEPQTELLWVNVQPIIDLLLSSAIEVQLLGCYLVANLGKTNQYKSKFYTEGAIEPLQRILSTTPSSKLRSYVCLAMVNLGLAPPAVTLSSDLVAAASDWQSPVSDMSALLKAVNCHDLIPMFEEHRIDFDAFLLLTENDMGNLGMQLGSRRKLMALKNSIERSRSGSAHSDVKSVMNQFNHVVHEQATSIANSACTISEDDNVSRQCLVCLDQFREVCLYPCGHVVACAQCAQILKAREDRCPICRQPVLGFVRPFFV
eukprot:GILJ01010812.1.p1 GENE.GILJ01010812.1~~GILJ01010812.1.p1  ORF type:complete len:541 (+),score=68.83 GILJ01010812.1:43-1665(+)